MSSPIDNVLSKLDKVTGGHGQWSAKCPCRDDDDSPSLRIAVGKEDQVMLKCLRGGGCNVNEIVGHLGMEMTDLFPEREKPVEVKKAIKRLDNTYQYFDAEGSLVMEVLRYRFSDGRKTFQQRRPNPEGGWIWSMGDTVKPLYRMPQVLRAVANGVTVFVVEGEKDVETLEGLGKVATTNPGGAGGPGQHKWMPHHTAALAGGKVALVCDNDEPGRLHVKGVKGDLVEAGCAVKVLAPPSQYKDVSDMVEGGGTLSDLEEFDVDSYHFDDAKLNMEEPVEEPDPIGDFIAEITDVSKRDLSVAAMASAIRVKSESLLLDSTGEHQMDKGKHVLWRPFLEEDADVSYDWIIPNLLERQERVIVVAAEGAGKMLSLSEPLLTTKGWKTIGTVEPGDEVFDRFGNPCNVVQVHPIVESPEVKEITFHNGIKKKACVDHNWLTINYKNRQIGTYDERPIDCREWTHKVNTTQEISDTLMAREGHTVNHAIAVSGALNYPEAALPLDPYTLGVWLGDGTSVEGAVSLGDVDAPYIIKRIESAGWVLGPDTKHDDAACTTRTIYKLKLTLRAIGLLGNKHIPEAYLTASIPQRLALLQGIMDTDGYIQNTIGEGRGFGAANLELTQVNQKLAHGAMALIRSLGNIATLTVSEAAYYVDGVKTVTNDRHRIRWQADPHNSNPFSLPRKAGTVSPLKTQRSKLWFITDVQPTDTEPMRCISVDSPDNSYLVGEELIPTHNTTLARQLAMLTAAGIHPFKLTTMKPLRTLMIDLENPERIIRRTTGQIYKRIQATGRHELMEGAHLVMKPDGVNLLKAADRSMIEQYVADTNPDILFLGPLYKAFLDPGGLTAEAVSGQIARYLDHLRVTYDCAMWIEHHAPLGSGGSRDLRPFGSAVWSRWSEFGIALKPDPTDPELIMFDHYRGQREPREWPIVCKRGKTWPFEVVEFQDFDPNSYNEPRTPTREETESLANRSFDENDETPW